MAITTHHKRPTDIAREALVWLASERLPPTPENYQQVYCRIAGTSTNNCFPSEELERLANAFPRHTPGQIESADRLTSAIKSQQWELVRHALLLATAPTAGQSTPDTAENMRTTGGEAQPLSTSPCDTLAELFSLLVRRGLKPVAQDNPELDAEIEAIAHSLEQLPLTSDTTNLRQSISSLSDRLRWIEEDRKAIRDALLNLLRLLLDNIEQLAVDDTWLKGQIVMVSEVFDHPLDIRILDEAERRLRDVIDKQSCLKSQLEDAQSKLKNMLIGFTDQLVGFSSSTKKYEHTLENCASSIESADNLEQLADAVGVLLTETHEVRSATQQSVSQLEALQTEVHTANQRISFLQAELDQASALVRHDPLTGVLNRKGLDDAFEREVSRLRRSDSTLAVALLDIDNFKALNDTHGHRAGDEALRHLANIIRTDLRPSDTVGRYGGEEFVILLPDTDGDLAVEIVSRLQRQLTKHYFMADEKRLLITFSAGVTLFRPDEATGDAIERADRAMYAAKRAGKNRVFMSPP